MSGGGFSIFHPTPTWQHSAVEAYHAEAKKMKNIPQSGYNTAGRGYPDITLSDYDYLIRDKGRIIRTSGTAISAAVLAGMITRINAARLAAGKGSVGWLNPAMYANPHIFNDVMSGDDMYNRSGRCCTHGFSATKGWDPASGLGSVDYTALELLFLPHGTETKLLDEREVDDDTAQASSVDGGRASCESKKNAPHLSHQVNCHASHGTDIAAHVHGSFHALSSLTSTIKHPSAPSRRPLHNTQYRVSQSMSAPILIAKFVASKIGAFSSISLASLRMLQTGRHIGHPISLLTAVPNSAPSMPPSIAATGAPSIVTSERPTFAMTGANSPAPSERPTLGMTGGPSATPSERPTLGMAGGSSGAPGQRPILGMTGAPSVAPSERPTFAMTGAPSVAPSERPTVALTGGSSVAPSESPTVAMSGAPSGEPSQSPTVAMTGGPSGAPSQRPTVAMSGAPSATPSQSPTVAMAGGSSGAPSQRPTLGMTSAPSATPSRRPTLGMAGASGVEPSQRPTVAMTGAPSAAPSERPSAVAITPSSRTFVPTVAAQSAQPARPLSSSPTPSPTPDLSQTPSVFNISESSSLPTTSNSSDEQDQSNPPSTYRTLSSYPISYPTISPNCATASTLLVTQV